MTQQYIIGGLRFTTDRLLSDLSDNGFSDLDVDLTFTHTPTIANPLHGPDGTFGSFDSAAGSLVLEDQDDDSANAWLLRQMAPVVSSVSERLVLHASAVALAGGVVAFVGESGVGKSTLAKAFPRPVSDDLVPVRYEETLVAPAGDTLTPLVAICFLERAHEKLSVDRLPEATAFELEIENGFGEHGSPDTWAFQFDAYHRLVEDVSHYRLTIPNDLRELPSAVEFIEANV
jgi:hypothetical protein